MNKIIIRETQEDDLIEVMNLWNDGDVTKFVGFPDGIGVAMEQMERWHEDIQRIPLTKHFSIFHEELGYCGESFYSIDTKNDLGTLDIKLYSKARGKGIGRYALEYAINEVFETGNCSRVYVDPDRVNVKAWALYKKIGFKEAKRPEFLEPSDVYLELSIDEFNIEK